MKWITAGITRIVLLNFNRRLIYISLLGKFANQMFHDIIVSRQI